MLENRASRWQPPFLSYLAYLLQSLALLFLLAEAGVRTRVVVVVALRFPLRGWKELTENAISTKCRRLGHRRRRRAPPGTVRIRRPQEWSPNVPYCKCHTLVICQSVQTLSPTHRGHHMRTVRNRSLHPPRPPCSLPFLTASVGDARDFTSAAAADFTLGDGAVPESRRAISLTGGKRHRRRRSHLLEIKAP